MGPTAACGRRSSLLRTALCVLALCASGADAATITVTSLSDSGAGSLREAIYASLSGDTIVFSVSGTIPVTAGTLNLVPGTTIDGGTFNLILLDGVGANRIATVPVGPAVTLKNLTIQNGGSTNSNGGAIVVQAGGALVIDRCAVASNTSTSSSGGAIANYGTTTITGATFTNNTTGAGSGGAVYNAGTLHVTDTMLAANSAPNDGGAIMNDSPGTLSVLNSTFWGNAANANGGGGGAIANYGAATIAGSTFAVNHAVGYGGAIRADASGAPGFGKLDIANSTFASNSSGGNAGGGAIGAVNAGTVRVFSSTFSANAVTGTAYGGAIYVSSPAQVQMKNSILSGNTAPPGFGPDCAFTIASLGYNLVSNVAECTFTGTTTGNVTGVAADLVPFANNGGPTLTFALNPGSPAINAADPTGCTDPDGVALPTDQRGSPRASNGRCDMGAYELQVLGPPTVQTVVSRKGHGSVGTFDLPLGTLPADPTTEPRWGGPTGIHSIVFKFDRTVTSGTALVTESAATTGSVAFNDIEMIVPLSGVANAHYVTLTVSGVAGPSGPGGGTGSVRVGFLAGDTSQSHVVTLSDLLRVNASMAQPVTLLNFLRDLDASGDVTLADKQFVNSRLTQALPAP